MASSPFDAALYGIAYRWQLATSHRVPDEVAHLGDLDHIEAGEGAEIVGLSATGRVERGLVERDRVRAHTHDVCGEVLEICIAEVQQICVHRRSLTHGWPVRQSRRRQPRRAHDEGDSHEGDNDERANDKDSNDSGLDRKVPIKA